ncbi:uncharacterized protein LOC130390298 [Gadus chalcogrammus]|uniref:uncharacterized protein LOC130390298 n=1 Tax=Gadus chalcogrammus TaxID=1042646 RepID=UPI0024C4B5A2|nr:uncharacterized protein LOC130390298 [Gadus chalcogrammus]
MLNMGAVLLLLIGVTDGVKTFCNATQPHITTQCFGSLGGTVEVLLPTKTSQNDTYLLKKNNVPTLSERIQTNIRYSFNVSTGIFTIKDIDRTDNGEYSIEVHDTTGKLVASTKCYLTIEAPVSSPLLSRECLSRGQQRVSCSAGGDGLHYSWSLDGLPLNGTRLPPGPGNASDVTLEVGRSGLVTCSVRNNVSHAAANITLSVCDVYVLIIAGSLSAMALLLIVVLGVYCAKKNKTSKDTTEAEDVTYADISVLQRQGQRREQGEGEVEYGQVKVAPGPRRTLETNVDECVYAQPRRTRTFKIGAFTAHFRL